jgi:hypothetical protein
MFFSVIDPLVHCQTSISSISSSTHDPASPKVGISDQKLRISDQTYLGRKSLTFDLAERRGYPLEMGVLMG